MSNPTTPVTSIYYNDIVSGFDLHKPEFLSSLYRRYGDQGVNMLQTLRAMGFEMNVAQQDYSHFEENWITDSFVNKTAFSAGAAGADVSMTLDASSLDASNRFYVRKFDIILFPNEVTAYVAAIDVSTPSAPVLTLRPQDVLDAIPATAAGATLIITGNMFSEGSGQPNGRFSGAYKYTNNTHIVKETIGATGTELTNESWVKVVDGKGIEGWFNKAYQIDLDYRMSKNMSGVFMFSKKTTNTAAVDPATGYAIRTTEGFFPYLRRLGNVYPYTPGSFTVSDFDEFDRILAANYAGNYVMAYLAQNLHIEVENKLVDFNKFTGIDYTRKVVNADLFGNDESLAVSVNFSLFTKATRTYLFKRFSELNDPKSYGATGYPMKNFGILFPLDKNRKDKSGNKIGNIGIRFKAMGGYSRKMETFELGSANVAIKTTDVDTKNVYQRTDMGAHFMGGNQMILITP